VGDVSLIFIWTVHELFEDLVEGQHVDTSELFTWIAKLPNVEASWGLWNSRRCARVEH
jgi:hypothetical protein